MSRRRATRRARRVQVQFWKQGEPTAYVGYTTNISMTGMFVATNSPMPSGTRIRVEVIDRNRGFMIEGVVAHARKVRTELAAITQSGMGVRFLSMEELVRELIPAAYGQTEEIPHNADRGSFSTSPNLHAEPDVPEPAAEPAPPRPAPAATPAREPVRTPTPPAVSLRSDPQRPAPAFTGSGGAFSIRFSNADEFLEVYRRDILQGGLFVSTRYPARMQETVSVELHPPLAFAEPVVIRARVVQRFEPGADSTGSPNLLAGMGLELIDLAALVERLQPIVERLRG
jgi:Tfp pilus assembly protein PilZ